MAVAAKSAGCGGCLPKGRDLSFRQVLSAELVERVGSQGRSYFQPLPMRARSWVSEAELHQLPKTILLYLICFGSSRRWQFVLEPLKNSKDIFLHYFGHSVHGPNI